MVARFEPENHVLEIVKGYVASRAEHPLIVVGSAPYANEYTAAIEAAADGRVRLLGGVWDQELLDQLYMNATTYLHGHSVGGTNPSLLRAAGAGAATIAFDTVFNREVVGDAGRYFTSPSTVAPLIEYAEAHPEETREMGRAAREGARRYDWDIVARQYEELCEELAAKSKKRKRPTGLRKKQRPADTVLVAHPSPDLYGSDRMLVETVAGLTEKGSGAVVAVPADGPLLPLLREQGAQTEIRRTPVLRKSIMTPVGALKTAGEALWNLVPSIRLIRSTGASTVLVNTLTIPLWIVAGRLSGARVVCHVHEAEAGQPGLVKKLMYAPLVFANEILVNSGFSLDVMAGAWPQLRRKATLVYNGVAGPERELRPTRAELVDGPTLLFVGRLSPRKGPQVAIAAIAELRDRGVAAKLRLLGAVFPGYEWFEEEIKAQVVSLGLQDRVEFLGFQPSIWDSVEETDIVIVPSVADEPFGNTAVEAMLGGRPLIVSETSGLKEAAGGFSAVRFVAPDQPKAVADAVVELSANWAAVRSEVGTDQERAEREFSPQRYRSQMRELVLSAGPRPEAAGEEHGN
ncbi:MAG: glycosyltransferase [Arachnia sp.]